MPNSDQFWKTDLLRRKARRRLAKRVQSQLELEHTLSEVLALVKNYRATQSQQIIVADGVLSNMQVSCFHRFMRRVCFEAVVIVVILREIVIHPRRFAVLHVNTRRGDIVLQVG